MLIEAIIDFKDLQEHVDRKAGERFEVTPERFSEINSTRWGQMAMEVAEAPEKAPEGLQEAPAEDKPKEAPAEEKPEKPARPVRRRR